MTKLVLAVYADVVEKGAGTNLVECTAGSTAILDMIVESIRAILNNNEIDGATAAMTISLPSLSELIQVRVQYCATG